MPDATYDVLEPAAAMKELLPHWHPVIVRERISYWECRTKFHTVGIVDQRQCATGKFIALRWSPFAWSTSQYVLGTFDELCEAQVAVERSWYDRCQVTRGLEPSITDTRRSTRAGTRNA